TVKAQPIQNPPPGPGELALLANEGGPEPQPPLQPPAPPAPAQQIAGGNANAGDGMGFLGEDEGVQQGPPNMINALWLLMKLSFMRRPVAAVPAVQNDNNPGDLPAQDAGNADNANVPPCIRKYLVQKQNQHDINYVNSFTSNLLFGASSSLKQVTGLISFLIGVWRPEEKV
ncbi:hypothetical protein HDU76_006383, partial [Blyttiomyces sp. JEL0837]